MIGDDELRRKTEALFRQKKKLSHDRLQGLSAEEISALVYEFQVHQVELEMQNAELHRTQIELEAANRKYFDFYDMAPVGYLTLNVKGSILESNLTASNMLGTVRSELVKQPFQHFIFKDDQDGFSIFLRKLLQSKSVQSRDLRILKTDGIVFWTRLVCTGVSDGDGVSLCRVVMSDINEQKSGEQALHLSEMDLRHAQAIAHIGSWKWNLKTAEVSWSDEMYRIFGIDKKNYTGKLGDVIRNRIHPDDLHVVLPANAAAIANEPFEYRISLPDGEIRTIWAKSSETVFGDAGKPLFMTGVAQDITDRKLAEEKLKRQNSLFETLLLNLQIGVYMIEVPSGKPLLANEASFNLLGRGIVPEANSATISKVYDLYKCDSGKPYPNEELPLVVAMGGISKHVDDMIVVKPDGSRTRLEVFGSPIRDERGTIWASLVSFQDITERKAAEDKIGKLLAEKEIILKEVHHRMKNNMSTIRSMLSLQAITVAEPSASAALEDAGSRIYSMGMLYDKLYQSQCFSELSLCEYLEPLVDDIISNFSRAETVEVVKHIDDFVLDVKRLQPIGIIVNELLTNIMKYAFTDGSDGIITVSATLSDGTVAVCVKDNGVGIPQSLDFQNSSGFGLRLLRLMAEQLEGTINIERDGGTKVILEFML